MRSIDKELSKINNSQIKRLEKTLDAVNYEEARLLQEFDSDILAILGKAAMPIIRELNKKTTIENGKVKYLVDTVRSSRKVNAGGNSYKLPDSFLRVVHKSYLTGEQRQAYEEALKVWFTKKTIELKKRLRDVNSYEELERILPEAYALASLALTAFHKLPNMILRDVQKLTGIALAEGDIAELGTGEGKTLSAVLPVYLMALRGKGSHVITSNPYLAKRDFEETLPIFEVLGLSSGYLPENVEEYAVQLGMNPRTLSALDKSKLNKRLVKVKQEAYRKDITYGAKSTFAFDYLRDNRIKKQEDMVQRLERPGFALIDEVDDALVDDAQVPYRIAQGTPTYEKGMNLIDLCIMLNVSYKEIKPKVEELRIPIMNMSYEEASYVARAFCNAELLPDQSTYQELAQLYFESQPVLVTEDKMYGFRTGRDLYNAILDERNYNTDAIKAKYGVIYCREKKEYTITDHCYEGFLRYSYLALHLNSEVISYQDKLLDDRKYVKDVDYKIVRGRVLLTMPGAEKILHDPAYPRIYEGYRKYMNAVSSESAAMSHYFKQAVVANLVMKKGQDYTVVGGKVKVMKNGRIAEGSTYSNGLHQALEIKENIPRSQRSKENISSSSITQKDFYSRYDMFAGMTGTSSKEIFSQIYGKATIEVPKHAFYSYFGRRRVKGAPEPIGVDKKDTKFALTQTEKVNLMVKSIIKSLRMSPPQPVLLVVSNVDEIKLLEAALQAYNIPFSVLTGNTPKDKEAEIIANAGRPGAVTISTEMAGRGTDIKVGGDRETIIDIATANYIKALDKKFPGVGSAFTTREKEEIRQKVERSLMDPKKYGLWSREEEKSTANIMSKTGLKVISSGYFGMDRIDRQLEGRTGRNGISGTTERFVCPDDLKNIGITSIDGRNSITDFFKKFKKKDDGSLAVDRRGARTIEDRVKVIQQTHETSIKENIKNTQKLDSFATKLVEDYRERRRQIICDQVDLVQELRTVIENSVDAIFASYIKETKFSKQDLLDPLATSRVNMNFEAITLEIRKTLGVHFNPKQVFASGINFLEFRNAVVESALEAAKKMDREKIKEALLAKYDFMITNIPYLLEHSFTVKRLTSMSMGMEGQADYNAEMAFYNERQKMILDANRHASEQLIGRPLSLTQDKRLQAIKEQRFGMRVTDRKAPDGSYEVAESPHEENNLEIITNIRDRKKTIDKKNAPKVEKVERKIEELEKRGKHVKISHLYQNLQVRPMMFVSSMVNGKEESKLVLVRHVKQLPEEEQKKL